MDKQYLPPSPTMHQRIYDRAYDELRLLQSTLKTRADDGFNDEFRSDVFRKHKLFLTSYANLCHEKNAAKVLFNIIDPKFNDLNNWAKTMLKGFVPDEIHGIKPTENPQVPTFKTKIPPDVRNDFDLAMNNAAIKKAYVERKLEWRELKKHQIKSEFENIKHIKAALVEGFEQISKQDRGHWTNLKEVGRDFADALQMLDHTVVFLRLAEKTAPEEIRP